MIGCSLVCVIDDVESVRESLLELVEAFGCEGRAFASAEAFLESGCLSATNCLIVDVAMPGMTGPELQEELLRAQHSIPMVFMTAHPDVSTQKLVIERGAVAFLLKPFRDTALRDALNAALHQ